MVTNLGGMLAERLSERTSRGLAQAVSSAISEGVLTEGMKLPSIRALAAELGLSPSTVSAAWDQLSQARAIRTDGRRGTTVAPVRNIGPTRYRRALERSASFRLDLSTGVPDPSLLPDLAEVLRNLQPTWAGASYLDSAVIPELEQVLRQDWPYDPEGMTIVDGAMDALDQVSSLLLHYGDTALVENPSFPPLLDLLDAMGIRAVGVDIDTQGVTPDALRVGLTARPKALFLQPRAQNPTGSALVADRVRDLYSLLADMPIMVVEDDSAGAISSWPATSLGKWLPDQTIHIRSFSKSHGPDLRLAAVSGPQQIIDRLMERRLLGQGWTSRLLQAVLAHLLTSDSSCAQVKRARETYARRREAMLEALGRRGVHLAAPDGLNIWLPVRDEPAALLHLATLGIGAAAGNPFTTHANPTPHLRVTAGLAGTAESERVAGFLAEAARSAPWSGPR